MTMIVSVWHGLAWTDETPGTHHESLKVGAEPLRDTVPDLPVVVDAMRVIKLTTRGGETLVKTSLESFNFVFSGFQVVSGAAVSEFKIEQGFKNVRVFANIIKREDRFVSSIPSARDANRRMSTHSLKKALAICSIRICGWPWS